jgi:hypothetical protein
VARTAIVALLLLLSTTARADPETRAAMEDYFAGEKRGGITLFVMGGVGIAAGTALAWASDDDRARGASYVLLPVGVLHATAGAFVYFVSNGRIHKFGKAIEADADAFVVAESSRMKGVSLQFTILKGIEIAGIAAGITLAVVGNRSDRPRLEGAGYALAAEMAATLVFDIVAAKRAGHYRARLAGIATAFDPATGTPMLTVHGRF